MCTTIIIPVTAVCNEQEQSKCIPGALLVHDFTPVHWCSSPLVRFITLWCSGAAGGVHCMRSAAYHLVAA